MSDQATIVLDPRLTHFLAIGNNHGWGKATTEKQAIANMNRVGTKAERFVIYRCTDGTYVNETGGINRPAIDPEAVMVRKQTPLTRAKLLRFVRVRNKSGFQSNLQFQFDADECGFSVKDLGDPVKCQNFETTGEYRWVTPFGTLVEKQYFGGQMELRD